MIGSPSKDTLGQLVYPVMVGSTKVATVSVPNGMNEDDVDFLAGQLGELIKVLRADAEDK